MKHTFLRFLSVLFVLTLTLTQVYAVPAYRGWRTMTQPDGTTITIRQMGDEFFHYWENEDGQQVAKDAEGFWRVVEQPAEQSATQKRKQASRRYNQSEPNKPAKVGAINLAPRGLVILVNYSDVSFQTGNTQSAMTDLMNSENYTYNSATGSVREFFKAQSNGAYVPDFDVVGPYTLQNNRAHYGGNDSGGDDLLAGDMIVEACKAADAAGVDFTLYNNDGDSYVDFVYVIYAGDGEADGGPDESIWPHNWTISSARYYSNCTYSKENSKVDGLYIENYACSGELKGGTTTRCPIGTIAHEFGHVLGLPDYYVTSKTASNYGKKYTPGAWHIMDYGSYNNDGRTPPNYSPHDKNFFGWSTPTLLAKDAQKNCTLTTTYGSAYQITGGTALKAATASDRVWYLENRQKSGWDKYLPGHGMVVWEVTYNSSNWSSNVPNNETVGYTVVTANSLSRPYTPYKTSTTSTSTSGTPFPGTSNVTSWTPATGCAITNIAESAGNITFKYNGGQEKWSYTLYGQDCTYPEDGEVNFNAPLSLTITPDAGFRLDDPACWEVTMGGSPLVYGTGFTYTGTTFSIASVTGDVEILIEGGYAVTWSANGSTHATNVAAGGRIHLPSTPSDCSGSGGKKFVGWTAQSSVTGTAPSDLFTEAGSKTVTANTTYYAVYASGSGGASGTVTITTSTTNIPTGSYGSANTFTEYTFEGYKFKVQQMYLNSGKLQWRAAGNSSGTGTMYNTQTYPGKISSIVLTYNSSDGNKNFTVKVGNSENPTGGTSITPTSSGLVYTFDCSSANADYFVMANGSGAGYLDQVQINYGGGTSYSDYSLICGTPCSNTPTMSFSEPTVNKTTADASFTKTVTITGKGSGQTVAYSSSDETVATVNSSGVVTLQGKVGSTTITASVEANGTYCAASASYTLNVSAAPINVTLYYNGTSTILNNQTPPYTLPTTGAYVADMCDGDWTFAGWYNNAYDKNTTAPTYITQLTATGSAYAVYTTTENGSGGASGTVTITTSTTNIPTGSYGSANTFTEYTFEGYKFKVQQMYLNSGKLQWRAAGNSSGTGTMYNTQTYPGKISSIVLTYNSSDGNKNFTVKVGNSENPTGGTSITPTNSGLVYTFDCSSENADYFVMTNGTYAGYLDQIQINYGGGGSSTTYYATTPDCSTPPATDYTVTWKACGDTFHTQGFADGAALVLPASTPADNAGKTFVGWTETEHHTGAGAPADLFTTAGSKTVTADVTYYAVFH